MDPEEIMGWAEASPSMPSTMSGERENHRQEVSVTGALQRRNLVDFQPKITEIT